ncbi:alpha/beta hydrolase [Streptomyces sp. NPDC002825]|uniref:alpha/beta hydrolase n=1 Tax=Streptomyces sp. NPDC002825 TaxID=3154666 RepID=UPI00333261A0
MTYAFDPELAPWAAKLPRLDYGDLAAARAFLEAAVGRQPPYRPTAPVDVRELLVPGRRGAPQVPVRVYRPAGSADRLPALVYLRWGGFVFGHLDSIHATATRLAEQVGAVVVSVGYRNAPEHPFPAPLDDCYAALEWTAEHHAELGVDPDRIGIGGESAGGGLAAAVALLARDRGGPALRFQCLVHPELDDRLETRSAREFTDTPKWDRDSARHSWRHYLGATRHPDDPVSPYAAPARAEDLAGLPPAFISACEFDPLRDENILYAHRLIQAGVPTELIHYPGTFHGCLSFADTEVVRRMTADQTAALRRGLGA